jgi:tetratricopeptide (TPR) repeat protein
LAGEGLFLHWLLLQELDRKGHAEQAKTEIQEIKRIQRQAGPKRLPFLSSQALRLAAELKERRFIAPALDLVELALFLDPKSVEARYVKASVLWKAGGFPVRDFLREVCSGVMMTFKEERKVPTLFVNLLSAAVLAYFAVFLLFGAILFLKYEPLLRHEFTERTKISVTPGGLLSLLGFLYLLPLFLLLGWSWLLFFWIFLIFPYCRWKERIILSLLILLLLTLPSFYPYAGWVQVAQNDRLMEAATQVEDGLQGKGAANFLTRYAAEHPEDPVSRFYFALLLKEEGKLEEAAGELQRYLERYPDRAPAHNNLGNIYVLQGKYEEAENQYRKAVEMDPKVASTHVNLSLLYAYFPQRLRIEEAQEEFRKAEQLQPGITAGIETYENMPLERSLIYQSLPRRELWEATHQGWKERDLLAQALWGERIRFIPLKSLVLFPFAVVVVLWVSYWLRTRGPNPRFCPRCGQEICDLCAKRAEKETCCSACYAIFHSKEGIDPRARIERLLWKDRHGEQEKRKVRIASLLPGAASFYLKESWTGLVHSAFFVLFLVYWAKWSEITPAPSIFSHHFPLLWGTAFLIPVGTLYAASIIRGLRWSP